MSRYLWRFCYTCLVTPLMRIAVHLIALKNTNLRDGLQGRKGLWKRLDTQLASRNPQAPLIWFHVSSAGEFLQAQPVLNRFLQHGYACAVTFTSVNAYKWLQCATFPEGRRPLVIDYLPLDSPGNMRRLLNTLQPSVLIYTRYDLWPNLVWETHRQGIPQYVISATIQPNSKRWTSALGRSFYRSLYGCLEGIFTVTEDDLNRFRVSTPEHPNMRVTGDTRFDSVLDRKKTLLPPRLPASFTDQFVFIAGSSWPPDETCIFPALQEALNRYPDLRLIIVPHEPTEEHLRHSETFFKDTPLIRLTALQETSEQPGQHYRIVLGDTIGVLSALYTAGNLAYVGGGFTTGVHNVMEPAVMGLPVIFGPKHENSPEALDLLKQGLAFSVKTPADFRDQFFAFIENQRHCQELGRQARQVIESRAGAADRCFDLITADLTGFEKPVRS